MFFDKHKFAELLEKAKGKRSINQYAYNSGVSSAHISRLMRELLDAPPSPETIKSLSKEAHNQVTYEELMEAAGHINNDIVKENNSLYTTSEQEFLDNLHLTEEEIIEKFKGRLEIAGQKVTKEELVEAIKHIKFLRFSKTLDDK